MEHHASIVNKNIFDSLGFVWDRIVVPKNVPVHETARVTFRLKKMLAQYVFDASVLEGNPFTYPQVKTILDGVTVGGHKLSDQDQVRNLADSTKLLLQLVVSNSFRLDKDTFTSLHSIVAKEEAFEWGNFRGEGNEKNYTPHVGLGAEEDYIPSLTQDGAPVLNNLFSNGVNHLNLISNPLERGVAFFLFGALHQFFFDGNKRTSRMMMNGVLMSHGIDAISIPATRAQEFNEKMVDFYITKDATVMMKFMIDCHPEAALMKSAP